MRTVFKLLSNFARGHVSITPADADLPREMAIRCVTAGNCVITDHWGTTITVAMVAGEVYLTLARRVAAASTGTYTGHW